MEITEKEFKGRASGKTAVEELGDYAKARMAELEKTKRLLIVVVAILMVCSSAIFVFAPENKNTVATIMGSVLLVMALGAVGVSKFLLKTPFGTIDTSGKAPTPEGSGTGDLAEDAPRAQV